jgi:HD-GYP domain-containing protein (c-di-GMP phosphodiesterase class II)
MGTSSTAGAQLIFGHLHAMVRGAGLYPPTHPQVRAAKETLLEALTAHLASHGKLVYRLVGDLLIADERILSRESLIYRRFLEVCRAERGIGSITFIRGVEPREIDALLEAFTEGVGPSLSSWLAQRVLTHVFLAPPVDPDKQSGEVVARRAYSGSVEVLRDIEATIRSRAPVSVEQIGTLRIFTATLLDQILQNPALVLRLASIKSYDEYTLYHSVNVAVISIGLGVALGLPDSVLRELAMAGVLHDLGKIAIPVELLQKPAALDEAEWRIMRRHPLLGASLLSRLPGSNRLAMIVAFEHHMRFDGAGYPQVEGQWKQLALSRLACVADVYDAMTSRRSYKRAYPTGDVRAYLGSESGAIFDPRLVRVLDHMLAHVSEDEQAEAPA